MTKEIHSNDSLEYGASESGETSGAEEPAEEAVGIGKDAVKNDGKMGEELGYDVKGTYQQKRSKKSSLLTNVRQAGERTPYGTKHKFNARILVPPDADSDGSLTDQDTPEMVNNRDG